MANNVFQKIIDKELPADIVYEDERSLAFRDVNPLAPTHILIIPKKPIENIFDADEADEALLGHLFIAARKVAEKLGLQDKGVRLIINNGPDAGQEVPHIHIHFMGGKRMGWKPIG